MATTKVQS